MDGLDTLRERRLCIPTRTGQISHRVGLSTVYRTEERRLSIGKSKHPWLPLVYGPSGPCAPLLAFGD